MDWQEVTSSQSMVRVLDSWTPPDTAAINRDARHNRTFVAEIQHEGRGSA